MAEVEISGTISSVSVLTAKLKKTVTISGTITATSEFTGIIPCYVILDGSIDGTSNVIGSIRVIVGEPNIDTHFHIPRTNNHPYKDWHRVMNVQLDESTYNTTNLIYVYVPYVEGMNADFSDVRFAYGQNELAFSIILTTADYMAAIIDLPYKEVPEIQCYFDNPNETTTTGLSATAYTSRFAFIDTFSSNPSVINWQTGCSCVPLTAYTSDNGNLILKQQKVSYSYFPAYLLTQTAFARDTTVLCIYKPICNVIEFGFYGSPDSYLCVTYGTTLPYKGNVCGHYFHTDSITSDRAVVTTLDKLDYDPSYHVYAGKMHKAMISNTYTQFDHYVDNTCIYKHLVEGASYDTCNFSLFKYQWIKTDVEAAQYIALIDTVIAATSMHIGTCDTPAFNPYYTGLPYLITTRPSGPVISNLSVTPLTGYISSDVDTQTFVVSFDLDDRDVLRPASNLTVSMTDDLYYSDLTGASSNHIDVNIVVTGGTSAGSHDIILNASNQFGNVTFTTPITIDLLTTINPHHLSIQYPKRLTGINEFGEPEISDITIQGNMTFSTLDTEGAIIIKTDYGKTGSPLVYRVAKRIITFLHTYIWGALV